MGAEKGRKHQRSAAGKLAIAKKKPATKVVTRKPAGNVSAPKAKVKKATVGNVKKASSTDEKKAAYAVAEQADAEKQAKKATTQSSRASHRFSALASMMSVDFFSQSFTPLDLAVLQRCAKSFSDIVHLCAKRGLKNEFPYARFEEEVLVRASPARLGAVPACSGFYVGQLIEEEFVFEIAIDSVEFEEVADGGENGKPSRKENLTIHGVIHWRCIRGPYDPQLRGREWVRGTVQQDGSLHVDGFKVEPVHGLIVESRYELQVTDDGASLFVKSKTEDGIEEASLRRQNEADAVLWRESRAEHMRTCSHRLADEVRNSNGILLHTVIFEWHWRRMWKFSCTASALTEFDRKNIYKHFEHCEAFMSALADNPENMYAHFIPVLSCDRGRVDNYKNPGSSRVMGLPDLPLDMAWPVTNKNRDRDESKNKPWGPKHDAQLGIKPDLKKKLRIFEVPDDKRPLIFLSQINLAEAKKGYSGGSFWPFPSSGLLYFFIAGEFDDKCRVLFYEGQIDAAHLKPTRPSCWDWADGYNARGGARIAKRYSFSRKYKYLSGDKAIDKDERISELAGQWRTWNYMVAPGVTSPLKPETFILLADNCGLEFGDAQRLVMWADAKAVLKRQFDRAIAGSFDMDDRFFATEFPGYYGPC